MKIDISCANVDMTPAFAEYIEEKIGSCGDIVKRFEAAGTLDLFFKISRTTKHHAHGDVFTAEATLALPSKLIHIKTKGSDARAVVDELKDDLKVELRKYKERAVSQKRIKK